MIIPNKKMQDKKIIFEQIVDIAVEICYTRICNGMDLIAERSCIQTNILKRSEKMQFSMKCGVKQSIKRKDNPPPAAAVAAEESEKNEDREGTWKCVNAIFSLILRVSAIFFAHFCSFVKSSVLFFWKYTYKKVSFMHIFLFFSMLLQFVCLNGITNLCKEKNVSKRKVEERKTEHSSIL